VIGEKKEEGETAAAPAAPKEKEQKK